MRTLCLAVVARNWLAAIGGLRVVAQERTVDVAHLRAVARDWLAAIPAPAAVEQEREDAVASLDVPAPEQPAEAGEPANLRDEVPPVAELAGLGAGTVQPLQPAPVKGQADDFFALSPLPGVEEAFGVPDGGGGLAGAEVAVKDAIDSAAQALLSDEPAVVLLGSGYPSMPRSAERDMVRGAEQAVLRGIADALTSAGRPLPVLALESHDVPHGVLDGFNHGTVAPFAVWNAYVGEHLLDPVRDYSQVGGPMVDRLALARKQGFKVQFVDLRGADDHEAHMAGRLHDIFQAGQSVVWVGAPSRLVDVDASFLDHALGVPSIRDRSRAFGLRQVLPFVIGYSDGPDHLMPPSTTRIDSSTATT